jgi:hypothetical protein
VATLQLLPKAAATGNQLRQPHNRAAAAGSSGRLPTSNNIRRHRTSLCHTASVINLVSPDLVPPSLPRRRALREANPIDAETDQAREGKHRQRVILLD